MILTSRDDSLLDHSGPEVRFVPERHRRYEDLMAASMRYAYVKTGVLSMLLHVGLAFVALLMGWAAGPASPASQPAPIEVEIEPAKLKDMRNGGLQHLAGSPPPGTGKVTKSRAAATAKPGPRKSGPLKMETSSQAPSAPASTETFPPALSGESGGTTIAAPLLGPKDGAGVGRGPGGRGGFGTGGERGGGSGSSFGDGEGGGYAGAGFQSGDRPAYPRAARLAGREGVVLVRVLIGIDGKPISVTVRETSGHDDLDSSARQAVRRWQFYPAKRWGRPIESFHDVRVRFRLEDKG